MDAFKFRPNEKYRGGAVYKNKTLDLVNQKIYVNGEDSFNAKFYNLFQKYQNPTIHTNQPYNSWMHSSFDWWQCQLNFAVWMSTAGCGVSYEDHLQHEENLISTLFKFHVYYTISRILSELKVAKPTDQSYCYYKNTFDLNAYQRICSEFGVDPQTDWRQKLDVNQSSGLGVFSTFETPSDQYRMAHRSEGPFFNINDALAHQIDISNAWSTFILDRSNGFTHAGVTRINESIRIFVWALLGAQGQTRVNILKEGTGFDAQKQFLSNVQDAINSAIDLPNQISRYQDVLKFARSKVDYVYGIGLYMSPSDMTLQIGTIADYNNKIVIAKDSLSLGLNNDVNVMFTKPVVSVQGEAKLQGTKTVQTQPQPYYIQRYKIYADKHGLSQDWVNKCIDNPGYFENWIENDVQNIVVPKVKTAPTVQSAPKVQTTPTVQSAPSVQTTPKVQTAPTVQTAPKNVAHMKITK